MNVEKGAPKVQVLNTGRHIIRKIKCINCMDTIGWYYEKAFVPDEVYKEGKYIIERAYMSLFDSTESED